MYRPPLATAAGDPAAGRTCKTGAPKVAASDFGNICRVVPLGHGRCGDAAGRNERGLSGRRGDSILVGDSACVVPFVLYPVFRK